MIRTARLLLSGFAVALAATAAATDLATVELKSQVYVKGPAVTLGDIATIDGDDAPFLASIEIATAAMPGATRRLNAAVVLSRIESAGIGAEAIEFRGPSLISATTLARELSAEMLRADLRRFIEREMPWDPMQAEVRIVPPGQGLVVSDGELDIHWRANPQYNYLGSGSFRGEVLVDGQPERSFYAKAFIEAYEDVVVAARSLSRGERITPNNVRLEKRALSQLSNGAFFSPHDLLGYVARSSIQRGQLLTDRKVEPPVLVKRNQIVLVETAIGSLTVQAQARALNAAVAGELVVCESLSSEQEYSGIVRPDGVVVVAE